MKVAATCMHWSQPAVPQSPSSQALASSIPSPSPRRRNRDAALVCHLVHRFDRSALFSKSSNLLRSVSCDIPKSRRETLRRASSADSFSDEEFAENIRELAFRFHLSDDDESIESSSGRDFSGCHSSQLFSSSTEPPWIRIRPEPPYLILPASSSVDLPLSLKKNNQWKDDLREAGETAYCSVRKAFSSMVFIIRELHSYTLQMREFLFLEDVHGILDRVQREMHASFVWLFQQIFSHTPTLMMYVMILMANFTVHSMSNNIAMAAPPPMEYYSSVSTIENQNQIQPQSHKLDSSQLKTFFSIGGNSGGGGKVNSIGSGTDGGDGGFNGVSSFNHHNMVHDELSQVSSFGNPTSKEDESSRHLSVIEEAKLWNSIVDKALELQAALMDESLDHETMLQFVSPISAHIEPEDYSVYSNTESKYQQAIAQEPNNPLFLSNYAQFLYLVVHDHDRAEEYFKKASASKPSDAEALSKFASFLWMARKNIESAEETYLEAIEADPGNPFHAANYAHFLWNTGGEDTCYPLG